MDILDSLTADFDHLRDLTIDLSLASDARERESLFRQLVRYQDVTAKAQTSVVDVAEISFAQRKMLERCDVMDEIAMSVHRSNRNDVREMKMELYSDLVIQRIADSEREILPYIYEAVTADERARLGAAYEKYRDIALDLNVNHPRAV